MTAVASAFRPKFTLVMEQTLMSGSAQKIIARREQESLVIGEDIQVTVLEIGFTHVRLGLTCPRHDPPYWEETLAIPVATEPVAQATEPLTAAARF